MWLLCKYLINITWLNIFIWFMDFFVYSLFFSEYQ